MAEDKKMNNADAKDLMEIWADAMQLDTESELFEEVYEQLKLPVKREMLTFDEGSRTFTLQLFDKITTSGGSEVHMVEIKPCNFKSKRVLQKYKDNESIDSARAMLATYTSQSEAVVNELMDLDISRINAIICGFITQSMPGKKA